MMVKKKVCVISAIVIYVFLITLFVLLKEKTNFRNICNLNSPCVRFCCDDSDTCNDDFIKKNFDAKRVMPTQYEKENKDLKILYGSPECSLKPVSSDVDWEFTYVSSKLITTPIAMFTKFYFILARRCESGSQFLFQHRALLFTRLERER